MPFDTEFIPDPEKVDGGEVFGDKGINLSFDTFEDGLNAGRFAKLDSGSVDNFDGSATPNVVGIVRRSPANPVESDGTIDSSVTKQISISRTGPVSVDVVAGTTPPAFGAQVFASNDGNADDGLALDAAGGNNVATTAEFLEEIKTDVWLVRLGAFEPS